MGADTVTPTLFLAVLGLAGCAMILAAVVLDYVRPQRYTGWTLNVARTLVDESFVK